MIDLTDKARVKKGKGFIQQQNAFNVDLSLPAGFVIFTLTTCLIYDIFLSLPA